MAQLNRNWESRLIRDNDDKVIPNLHNLTLILCNHQEWVGVLAYNEFSGEEIKLMSPHFDLATTGSWADDDTTQTIIWFNRTYRINPAAERIERAVDNASRHSSFHPIKEYLLDLAFDGQPRLENFFPMYFGSDDNEYTRDIGEKFLISLVARILSPGAKVDTMLILEGTQGTGKSRALSVLAGTDYFMDEDLDFSNKDAQMQIRSCWIAELAELTSLTKTNTEKAKQFVSKTHDRFRKPYGKRVNVVARQCIFAGTTNRDNYLRDETGNRRFWPVKTGVVDLNALRRDRDQLFAEAVTKFHALIPWWHDSQPDYVILEQEKRAVADPWFDRTFELLMNCHEEYLTTTDILVKLGKHVDEMKPADAQRIGRVIAHINRVSETGAWEKVRRRTENGFQWIFKNPGK